MVTNSKLRLAFLVFTVGLFTILNNSCGKNCTDTTYGFVLPVKAYPNIDTVNIGDTIWLEINESVSFTNSDGSIIDYSGAANLGSAISFSYRDTILKQWLDAANDFQYKIVVGNSISNPYTQLVREFNFVEQNGRYLFKLGVIPNKMGLFRLLFSNSGNTFRKNDKCTKANFFINFKETNHNRHLVGYSGIDYPGGDLNFYVK